MIRLWRCPVHASDADRSTFSFAGRMIAPVGSRVLTDMDAMDSIVLSTRDAWCTIQLLCHMLSPRIFHSNYLPMSPRLCWIRGTCQIRLLGVYCFFVGSIFRWWCTRYIVHGWIISWLAHRWPFRWTDWCRTMMALVSPILQALKTCQVMALHRSRLSDIDNSELRVGSHQMMFFCRVCS